MSDEELIKETLMLDYNQLVMHNVYMIKENKRLENITKEIRKCIERYNLKYLRETNEHSLADVLEELLEILDKGE